MTGSSSNPQQRRARSIAAVCFLVAAGMVGAAYAAVPLYRIFCQVTGFAGTPQRAEQALDRDQVLDKAVTIRFDGNVAPGLPWRFKPVETTMQVKLGESVMAYYRATNTSDRRIVATAAYNISPEAVAYYFNKIECFCFTEQVLEPGQSVDMPVNFFIDPKMADDRNARDVAQVTVSYTFYPTATQSEANKPTAKSGS